MEPTNNELLESENALVADELRTQLASTPINVELVKLLEKRLVSRSTDPGLAEQLAAFHREHDPVPPQFAPRYLGPR